MEFMDNLCILCDRTVNQVKFKGDINNVNWSKWDLVLLPHLRVIYLLEQVFRRNVKQLEGLQELLEVLGNPSDWFGVCGKCEVEVDRGIELWRELKRIEVEHGRVLRRLREKVERVGGDGDFGRDIKPFWGQRGKPEVKRELRWKLKLCPTFTEAGGGVPEVKTEPEEEPPISSHFSEDDWCPNSNDSPSDPLSPSPSTKVKRKSPKRKIEHDEEEEPTHFSEEDDNWCPDESPPSKKRRRPPPKKKKRLNWTTVNMDSSSEEDCDSDRDSDYEPYPGFNAEVTAGKWDQNPEEEEEDDDDPDPVPLTKSAEVEPDPEFAAKCNEYLDLTLIPYPPKTVGDLLKYPITSIPSGGTWEDGRDSAGNHTCPSCSKNFRTWYFCLAHIHRSHLEIPHPWRCNQCLQTFTEVKLFRHHLQAHQEGTLIYCKVCKNFSSSKKSRVDCHLIQHFEKEANPQCPDCSEQFPDFKSFIKHMNSQHGYHWYHMQKIVCELCSKSVRTPKLLQFHKVVKHGEEDSEGIFPICEYCTKRFHTKHLLEIHIKERHTNVVSKPTPDETVSVPEKYICDQCPKEYTSKRRLMDHQATHVVKPEVCRVCLMTCHNPRKLQKHIQSQHNETKKMTDEEVLEYRRRHEENAKWSCGYCGQRFAFGCQFYHHQRESHPEITDKWKCGECGKGFSRGSSLKRHQETAHLGARVKCEFCGKEVSHKSNLFQHQIYYCVEKKRRQQPEQGYAHAVGPTPASGLDYQNHQTYKML